MTNYRKNANIALSLSMSETNNKSWESALIVQSRTYRIAAKEIGFKLP